MTLDSGPVFGSISDGFLGSMLGHFGSKNQLKSMLKINRFSDAFWEGPGAALSNYYVIEWIQSENLGPPAGWKI